MLNTKCKAKVLKTTLLQHGHFAPSFEIAHQIECGVNCTFAVHANGTSISSCGEGTNGKLGLGNSEDVTILSLISAIRGFTIVQMSASKGDYYTNNRLSRSQSQ